MTRFSQRSLAGAGRGSAEPADSRLTQCAGHGLAERAGRGPTQRAGHRLTQRGGTEPAGGAGAHPPRIVIVGGGYVGMYTALHLRRRLRKHEAEICVIDPKSYMTYQPFLPEAAAGNLAERHVVAPLRQVLRGVEVLNGTVTAICHAGRYVDFQPLAGQVRRISYDLIVIAPGSISRTLQIDGLADHGIGFKTVGEAIYLRNHVLTQLDIAASTQDLNVRHKALTFVFVGAGFAGVEALAELEDMARGACRYYPGIEPQQMRWMLVEASGRILPEVGPEMGLRALKQLRARGIDVRLRTRLTSAVDGRIVLDDGAELDASTLVWTAGVKPNPMLAESDLPVDPRGRLRATAELTVQETKGAFTAGDCAAVPDLTAPDRGAATMCAPNAQHALRQARRLALNVRAYLRGKPLKPYRHAYAGSVASLGLHRGVASVYGVKVTGWPAWFLHRTYHLARVPTLNRKVRVVADWTLALLFPREIVSLGTVERPREEFEQALASASRAGSALEDHQSH
jgi:NADH:ubiquinone reductase (H+-translocating)